MTDTLPSAIASKEESSLSSRLAAIDTADLGLLVSCLAKSSARKLDPLRFQLIESMATRALERKISVRVILERKIRIALANYQADYAKAEHCAASLVERVSTQFPEAADRIRSLFDDGDFTAVNRLAAKLNGGREAKHDGQEVSALAVLTNEINQGSLAAHAEADSLNDVLRQREDAALQASGLAKSKARAGILAAEDTQQFAVFGEACRGGRAIESSSVRDFRELLVKLDSDRLVARVISDGPEAPGPLNPQALVIRSLAALRDLSPDYLSRFVSYVDTLLWLEEAGEGRKLADHKARRAHLKTD
ncbi:DUF2894 domain-containing protein [Candidatus Accumulibacter sp. ACC003]|uniref:DUF2894 domain-containing protein n=1 Tax=Candidatus Accumulibacter sp. ACC003 TaxID=2823334 RepID=UPI0025C49CC1|nr:DUF2894 domain-containing protein [Candidatus Accumulibacter sp. ACC003]